MQCIIYSHATLYSVLCTILDCRAFVHSKEEVFVHSYFEIDYNLDIFDCRIVLYILYIVDKYIGKQADSYFTEIIIATVQNLQYFVNIHAIS